MKFAIIAAGEGSRLKQEGLEVDKPILKLNGEPMLRRLIRLFTVQGASEVVVIVNPQMPAVAEELRHIQSEHERDGLCPVTMTVKSTPSSMHSFDAISPWLENEPFCLTTTDTIFRAKDFGEYIQAFSQFEGDGLMAVTDYVDDEKPLYVGTREDMTIDGFYDTAHDCQYISGGVYCLKPKVIATLKKCIAEGQHRMRNFQRQMVADGLVLKAYPFQKILDVDHVTDIPKAEEFLKNE